MSNKTIININRNVIASNHKHGTTDPPIRTQVGSKKQTYGHGAVIKDKNGKEVGKIVYSPDKPLKCGARVWIEIDEDFEVELINK